MACVRGEGGLSGTVKFFPRRDGTLVVAEIFGLPEGTDEGFFAFHIHEGDSCCGESEGFPETGGHFNPRGAAHPGHAGDLPPLLSCNGYAYGAVFTDRFRVRDIIGRTAVIHEGADDFHTQPAGNSGTKIACGVIKRI